MRWAGGHVAVALGGGTVVMICAAAGVGVAAAIERGEAAWLVEMLGAGLVHLPAIWLTAGVVVALYGLAARAAPWGWIVLVYATVVGLLGDALDLPDHLRAGSPFHHVPDLPGGVVSPVPLVLLTTAAAALVVVGLAGLTRRDIDVA